MKEKIIYIYPLFATFVKKDIDFLQKKYDVISPKHLWNRKLQVPILFLKQFIFLLKNSRKSKVIFVMFGGYWSFLPTFFGKMFNKPVYIILGGTDCVSFPKLKYGSLRKPILRKFIAWSYKLSTKLLPVDASLVFTNYLYDENVTYKTQGYTSFFKNIKTPFQVISNGFDTQFFTSDVAKKIPNSFITVAKINDLKTFKLKGIDKILELATVFTHASFTIVGIDIEGLQLEKDIPKNVAMMPFLPADVFKKHLISHEFVVQLSISEGFPNALCEAMLCSCIPLVSNVGAMPTIVKEVGFVLKNAAVDSMIQQFSSILKTSVEKRQELGVLSRKKIVENYPLSKRENLFLKLIESS